jgi:hypothetical protein
LVRCTVKLAGNAIAGKTRVTSDIETNAFIPRTGRALRPPREGAFRRSPHPPTSPEIDELWDRLSHAYALVRRESPAEMIQEELEALRAMLDERRSAQLKKSE